MKLDTSQVTKLTITGLPNMDTIAVMTEDFGPGAGKITITCDGEAWTHYWSHMGENNTIRSFFGKCETPYLVGKIKGRIDARIPDEDDEALHTLLRKTIIECRREGDLTRDKARDLWEESTFACFGEHRALCEEVLGDDWWHHTPTQINPEYEWLTEIVNTIKEAFALQKTEVTA